MSYKIIAASWKQLNSKMKARWVKFTNSRIGSVEKIEQASSKEECLMEERTLSRRAVLRGALAVTCGLVMPITFFSSPAAGADAAAGSQKAAKKVSKTSVKYQYKPNGENRCGTCINFIAESKTCKRVEGLIDPNGWCILWGKPA
jgi:hypothetical protein